MNLIMQGKRANEPDVAEFISAIAAGNNAQLMVVACAAMAGLTTLGLIAASHQTGGRLVCIVKGIEELESSKHALNSDADQVEFVVGNAESLLSNEYKSADFVVIDCNLENHEGILGAIQNNREKSTIVLGCNAYWKDSWVWSRSNSHLFPIGEGLLLMRVPGKSQNSGGRNGGSGGERRSRWVVKVDKCTGEEHVFRIKLPGSRAVKA
ncbi:hypothetical protein HanRHA438_Chr16g0760481 [Helianthus annuus]|nr:hypothetical protein HanOQP8_Chr16g0616811 [Helianthus annuus]KAJ0821233.1 hypothetical protein HanPSC8_Chr16g0717611 [Helianthus annuus]KAJ0835886.1 hypothetical protein HanRHA438_Chr16g0760481 [Helianthus annuus]